MYDPADMQMMGIVNLLRQEIAEQGSIPFIRFMALALYHPEYGYYERSSGIIGQAGDFITNVSTGPLFGELLACQFKQWTKNMPRPVIVEAGAHDGRLAADILSALAGHTFEYWILEPSAKREAWQRETLRPFGSRVRWFSGEQAMAQENITGIVLAHELLDAFPCHRLGWDAKAHHWFEWGVGWGEDRFTWVRLPNQGEIGPKGILWQSSFPTLPEELLNVLPDGFTIELCPEAENWWGRMARLLHEGCLMAVDYGLEALDFFQPHRMEGTLRSYFRHHLMADVLANPGEQDITASVNFTAIRNAGEIAGLSTMVDEPQSRFLTRILQQLSQNGLNQWPPSKIRQFMTLTHEEHLGRAFRILVQTRPAGNHPIRSGGDNQNNS